MFSIIRLLQCLYLCVCLAAANVAFVTHVHHGSTSSNQRSVPMRVEKKNWSTDGRVRTANMSQLQTTPRKPFTTIVSSTQSNSQDANKNKEEKVAVVEESISAKLLKAELLRVIPKRPFGGPATNATTDATTVSKIANLVTALEYLTPLPPLSRSPVAVETLNGAWQLVYSDASEITRIAKLPLGFRLGPVFQPIDVANFKLENQALIKHATRLISGHTRVLAMFSLAPTGERNRVGVINVGNRANVKFQKVIFTLRRLLVLPTFGKIRKTATPNGPSEQKGIIPTLDITYLDDTLRISRGGDGSLFILVRPQKKKPMKMLPLDAANSIQVDPEAPTYDASVDILPSGRRDSK